MTAIAFIIIMKKLMKDPARFTAMAPLSYVNLMFTMFILFLIDWSIIIYGVLSFIKNSQL